MTTVAALYVAKGGCYYDLHGVEPWGEDRDARTYAGPHPVVAHPPCARWSMLAAIVEKRWGHKRGDDGGTFAAALASVRRWGGSWNIPLNPPRGRRSRCHARRATAGRATRPARGQPRSLNATTGEGRDDRGCDRRGKATSARALRRLRRRWGG